METIAVYWEPKIKTYGLVQKTGAILACVSLSLPDTTRMLRALRSHADLSEGLLMITSAPCDHERLSTCLVLDGRKANSPRDVIAECLNLDDGKARSQVLSAVDLIYFHGPHYGDRYGIAHRVVGALFTHGINLLATACSASSIYLVVPQGTAPAACEALAAEVVVPHAEPRS